VAADGKCGVPLRESRMRYLKMSILWQCRKVFPFPWIFLSRTDFGESLPDLIRKGV